MGMFRKAVDTGFSLFLLYIIAFLVVFGIVFRKMFVWMLENPEKVCKACSW